MEHQHAHIVVIEDLPEVREGLQEMLSHSRRFGGVSAYGSAEQMFGNGALDKAGLFILDIGLPGMNGVECLVRLKALRPSAKVLMFTVMEHDDKVFAALKAGADGYLLKRESPEKASGGHCRRPGTSSAPRAARFHGGSCSPSGKRR
ncbi:MAG: response regulator transcription factor [Saprospiraceae bacterium]|nr:response regulator transcription factor [Saprospiraceae bacterium]